MSNISDGRLDLVFGAPENWPVLRVTQPKQLNLENADFNLEANRSIIFGGNGKISAVGDLSFLTGATSLTEQLRIFANGNIGIGTGTRQPTDKLEVVGKIQATDLEVSGTVKAKSFIGEFPGLTEKVSKTGDIITGSLTIQQNLTVTGTVKATSFSGEFPGLTEKVSKAGDTMTGSLAIQNNLTVSGNLKLGDLTVNKFSSDGTFNGNSDLSVPTEKAVKTYVDGKLTGGSSQWSDATGSISYSKGNVGIGTNNPQDDLDVGGNLRILTNSNPIRFTSAWSGFPDSKPNQAEISNDTKDFKTLMIIGNKSAGGIRKVSVWDYLQINGGMDITGNVGIGTTTPTAKLHVFTPGNFGGNVKLFPTSGQGLDFSYDGGDDGIFGFTNYGQESGDTRFQWQAPNNQVRSLLFITNKGEVRGNLINTSSRELKENITNFSTQEAIEALANLNPVTFNYREDNQKQLKAGFSAEDVPELVATADRKGICALDIVAVLTKVIQHQHQELSSLKERLNALEARA